MLCAALLSLVLIGGGAQENDDRVEFAVVTHPKNRTTELTRDQLVRHLMAKARYWSRNQSVYLLLPRTDTAAKQFLLEQVYEMSEIELKRYWVELVYRNRLPAVPKVMPSTAVALAVSKSQPGALTLVEADAVKDREDILVLAIDGKRPGDAGYWPSMARKKAKEGSEESGPEEGETPDEDGKDKPEDGSWKASVLARSVNEAAGGSDESEDEFELLVSLLEDRLAEGGQHDVGPGLELRGFADVTLGARSLDFDGTSEEETSSEFALGQLDLFLTAQLGERVSFLNETVFETDEEDSAIIDVERLIIKYDFGDEASLQVGRVHSNIGYWNNAFHHGEWLQTTIGRPRVLEFEDDGGLLPVHLIGLSFESRTNLGGNELRASVEVGNGRGPTPDPPQITSDLNDPKAVNLAVAFRPGALENLHVGTGLYLDDIPTNTDPGDGPTHGALDEAIWNASAAYHGQDWIALSEFFRIEHDGDGGEANSMGYYFQLERRIGKWTPYARYEGLDVDDSDTFYEDLEDVNTYSLGLRWELNGWNAIKLQFSHSQIDGGPGEVDREESQILLQTAFAF